MSKRNKLGIHAEGERVCLDLLALSVEAAFTPKTQKKPLLEKLRLKAEILKHIIRSEYELGILEQKKYLRISEQLIEISKMANGWLNFVTQ